MPIIKKYDISSVEEVKKIYQQVKETQENNKYNTFTKKNIMLVRTTDIFPEDRELKALADSTFISKNSMNFIAESLQFSDLSREELDKLKTYELSYRSTIHFTENGLVSSHMYGNFDNRPFIILDPLVHHENEIINFAGQDTFIKGNVKLSSSAIIIMKEQDYLKYKDIYPELDTYNVILYNGISKEDKNAFMKNAENDLAVFDINDERAVVEAALMDLGYTPELIGSHYLINSPTSDKINQVNKELAQEHNVLYWTNHSSTDDYKEDFNKNMEISNIFNQQLLYFILNNHDMSIDMLPQPIRYDRYLTEYLINTFGLDIIINDIELFNKTIEKMKENNLLPTSEELINGNVPDIFENHIKLLNNSENISLK